MMMGDSRDARRRRRILLKGEAQKRPLMRSTTRAMSPSIQVSSRARVLTSSPVQPDKPGAEALARREELSSLMKPVRSMVDKVGEVDGKRAASEEAGGWRSLRSLSCSVVRLWRGADGLSSALAARGRLLRRILAWARRMACCRGEMVSGSMCWRSSWSLSMCSLGGGCLRSDGAGCWRCCCS